MRRLFIVAVACAIAPLAAGAAPCPPEMAEVPTADGAVCVDLWEASRADATETGVGVDSESAPKSQPLVLPWGAIPWADAKAACAAAGKRLCEITELAAACGGPDELTYPYGDAYASKKCNGFDAGLGKAAPTGSFPACVSPAGTFDLSGNVAEWTATLSSNEKNCVFGGDYFAGSFPPEQNADSESCHPKGATCIEYPDGAKFKNVGFRCCADPGSVPGEDVSVADAGTADAGGADVAGAELITQDVAVADAVDTAAPADTVAADAPVLDTVADAAHPMDSGAPPKADSEPVELPQLVIGGPEDGGEVAPAKDVGVAPAPAPAAGDGCAHAPGAPAPWAPLAAAGLALATLRRRRARAPRPSP